MNFKKDSWSKNYSTLTERNIGIINLEQQENLRNSTVCVFGVGGVGGLAAEMLVRSGIGKIKIVDNDSFDSTNRNRQIYSYTDTVSKSKIDVTEMYLKKINPEVQIEKFDKVNKKNIYNILEGVNIAILSLDSFVELLIIARTARELKIPLVESWALPYLNVRVIEPEGITYEEMYNIEDDLDIDNIKKDEIIAYNLKLIESLMVIPGLTDFFSPESINDMISGKISIRSFATYANINAVILASETTKRLLNIGKIANQGKLELYDIFNHKKINY